MHQFLLPTFSLLSRCRPIFASKIIASSSLRQFGVVVTNVDKAKFGDNFFKFFGRIQHFQLFVDVRKPRLYRVQWLNLSIFFLKPGTPVI